MTEKPRVSLIYKTGDKEEWGNHRPISVIYVVAKSVPLSFYLKEKKMQRRVLYLALRTPAWLINSDKCLVNEVRLLDFKRPLNAIEHKIFNNA